MKKGKFLIQIYKKTPDRKEYIKIEGYIKQEGNFWFGVHKWEGNESYTITELSTGQKVQNGKTIKECEAKLPNCAEIVKDFSTGRFKELYKKAQKECEEAYMKVDDAELAAMFWKITGGFH